MLSVGFYIDELNIESLNLTKILNGNPGIGGTEYITIKVAKLLADFGLDVVIYSPSKILLPTGIKFKKIKSIEESIALSESTNRILILRLYVSKHSEIIRIVRNYKSSKILFWLHLSPTQKIITELSVLNQVKGFICVENNQRVRLIDSLHNEKLFTIPHPAIYKAFDYKALKHDRVHICYLGALVPQKGFHLLSDIWPDIHLKFPKIKLYVIGSGDLYSSDKIFRNKMGTEEKYEKRIFNILQRNDDSVVFTGNLTPSERAKVFEQCGIGVANPSGATETFCLSAVEMQQYGIPVIAAKKFGLKDTIMDKKTGILVGSKTGLKKALETLIKDEALRLRMGKAAISQAHRKYNDRKITSYWISVLQNIDTDTPERISKEIKSINIKSSQAIAGLVNRNIIRICGGRWPMLITMWAVLSKIVKKVKFR